LKSRTRLNEAKTRISQREKNSYRPGMAIGKRELRTPQSIKMRKQIRTGAEIEKKSKVRQLWMGSTLRKLMGLGRKIREIQKRKVNTYKNDASDLGAWFKRIF
jgi:hypothetical protein